MSCGVGCRLGSDPKLLWLWCIAPIQPQSWEPPYATGAALYKKKKSVPVLGVRSLEYILIFLILYFKANSVPNVC